MGSRDADGGEHESYRRRRAVPPSTDLLAAAATFLLDRSPGCSAAERVVSCPFGTLAPGASATAEIAFTTSATGAAVNSAVVVGEQPDLQRLNDVAAAAVNVAGPGG